MGSRLLMETRSQEKRGAQDSTRPETSPSRAQRAERCSIRTWRHHDLSRRRWRTASRARSTRPYLSRDIGLVSGRFSEEHAERWRRPWQPPIMRGHFLTTSDSAMTKKLYIETHGCQMNEYDSSRMVDLLGEHQALEVTEKPEEADVILLNTCSIREKAQDKVF